MRSKSIANATKKYRKCDQKASQMRRFYLKQKEKNQKKKPPPNFKEKKRERNSSLTRRTKKEKKKENSSSSSSPSKKNFGLYFSSKRASLFVGKNCNIFRFSVCCGCILIRGEPNLPLYFVSDAFKIQKRVLHHPRKIKRLKRTLLPLMKFLPEMLKLMGRENHFEKWSRVSRITRTFASAIKTNHKLKRRATAIKTAKTK